MTQEQDVTALEPMATREEPTATASGIALRSADFATLAEALDYAATGDSGFNFYDGRGALTARLPYRELRAAPSSWPGAWRRSAVDSAWPWWQTPIPTSR